jgi:hypothetical protein
LTEDLKEGAIKLLGIFKEESAPEWDDYQGSEYKLVYPTTPLIDSIVMDIPVGPYYKYLNKTIKDSSYFPTTESGLVIKKKFLKVYLKERLRESYSESCAQEHFNLEASEEESVASLDTQV